MAAAYTLAGLVGTRLESADSDEREKLAPQIIQLLRALPGEVREPVLAAALRTLAREEAASAHLASLAAALPAADVLRGLRRLAREQGQLSSHALQMAQALAEAHEEMGPAPALPEPPADFAEMAALFREEDVDRYDLDAIAVEVAADPDAFGPDTESDDAIERRVVTTLLDMTASGPEIVRPLVLGRLREIFVRSLQLGRFAQAISIIRAVRDLAADPNLAERREVLDEFLANLADAPTLAALVAASRQPGGPPFVQVQTLVLALGASAARGLLEALAAEQDRGRRLRLIELAASLGAAIVPETRRLLADPRWYVVRNMVLLLRRVQDRSAMTEILRCADHPDLRVRLEAIRALFTFDSKVPRDLLARTINHPDPRLAEAAVLLSGQHGITQATDLLVEILLRRDFFGRHRSIRLKALRALADLGDAAVLPRLGRFFREWPFPLVAIEERRSVYRYLSSYDAGARAPWVARGEKSRDAVIRAIPGALSAVDRLVVSLVAGINMRALYGSEHPALANHVDRILEAVTAACQERQRDSLTFLVVGQDLVVEPQPLRTGSLYHQQFIRALTRRGVERLTVAHGLGAEECVRFLTPMALGGVPVSTRYITVGRVELQAAPVIEEGPGPGTGAGGGPGTGPGGDSAIEALTAQSVDGARDAFTEFRTDRRGGLVRLEQVVWGLMATTTPSCTR